jgi:hypothetical protein
MKRLLLSLVVLFSLLAPLSAAQAAEYRTFVGCNDLAENPIPAHVCQVGDFPAAYFESDVETEYEICVEFPDAEVLCLEEELAEGEVLYLNSITSELPGNHVVSWYVEGSEIGSWTFRLDAPAPPPVPAPVAPAPIAPVPPVVVAPAPAPTPTAACLKSQQQVTKLKGRLRSVGGAKQKAKLRAKLRSARAAATRLC